MITALSHGLRLFARTAQVCIVYAGTFALLGMVLIWLLSVAGLAPMGLPLVGGFLLVAPALLPGFFAISAVQRSGRKPAWRDVAKGILNTPRALWGLLLVCAFLFVIWMTDAGILYSFMLGRNYAGWEMLFPLSATLLRFHLGAAVAGSLFALIVFCITAYAVPLLIERRANLVTAVTASVRAVFRSIAANALWSLILATSVIFSIIVPLLLTIVLPIVAFATESLYRAVFPGSEDSQD
ncbi:DUF2189 domain-containing protein [Aromatoleum diolicum]|uniref:DUF2189 domain-containing protein n=1 Tax=Aromatoleum diolicum TaxID=75796 RepID=A0ABX1Q9E7_9RHOO|nr:DUF2189 domain-containing protein [Aromatoleum diolicum]